MKKKICLLLIEILLMMLLTCACSAGQETEGTTENKGDAPIGTAASPAITPDLNHNDVAEEIHPVDAEEAD